MKSRITSAIFMAICCLGTTTLLAQQKKVTTPQLEKAQEMLCIEEKVAAPAVLQYKSSETEKQSTPKYQRLQAETVSSNYNVSEATKKKNAALIAKQKENERKSKLAREKRDAMTKLVLARLKKANSIVLDNSTSN